MKRRGKFEGETQPSRVKRTIMARPLKGISRRTWTGEVLERGIKEK